MSLKLPSRLPESVGNGRQLFELQGDPLANPGLRDLSRKPQVLQARCPSQVVLEDLRGVGRQSTSIGAAIESGQLEALIVMGPIP